MGRRLARFELARRKLVLVGLYAIALSAPRVAFGAPPATPPVVRDSLPRGSVDEAWERPGFRLGLGFTVGPLWGGEPQTDATLIGATIRAAWRFGRRLSLAGTFAYGGLTGDLQGMRYALTLEPTWHPARGLSLGAGAGYAGLIVNRDAAFDGDSLLYSRAERSSAYLDSPSITSCNAGGAIGVLRIAYHFRIGRVGSTGPQATASAQWTRCTASGWSYTSVGEVVQWWRHLGVALAWTFLWR